MYLGIDCASMVATSPEIARGRLGAAGPAEVVVEGEAVAVDGEAGDVDCAARGSATGVSRAVARASAADEVCKRAMAEDRNVAQGEVPGKCDGVGC